MKHYSLLELNNLIKRTLDGNLEPSYWLVAEIGEMRVNQRGHCYFELVEKEDDHLLAKIKANLWAYNYRRLGAWFEAITGQPLKEGLKILANVAVQFHEVYGISVVIRDIDPNYTLGERARKKQEVINQLVQDGVFEMNRTLALPEVPQRIAIISSPTAAGYDDFMHQLNNNGHRYIFRARLFKAVMQGNEAVESLIMAMQQAFQCINDFDVLVIIRGGGAAVDLDCFDTYDIAAHVAQFPIPVITGIGHERDETVVDLVAHTKMKTPTAVSEFLISGLKMFEENLELHFDKIANYAGNRIHAENDKLNKLCHNLKYEGKKHLSDNQHKILNLQEKIIGMSKNCLKQQGEKLKHLSKSIKLLDPVNVLNRGYTITLKDNVLLKNAKDVKQGDQITTITNKNTIISNIETIKKDEQ